MKNKLLLMLALSATCSSVFANDTTKSKIEDGCVEIYGSICIDGKCQGQEKEDFEKMHNFCIDLMTDDSYINNALKNAIRMNTRIVSNENIEAIKRSIPEVKDEINKAETKIVEAVIAIRNFSKNDKELPVRLDSKTDLMKKEVLLSNYKSFFIYLLKDNNLLSYRDFYKTKIKTKEGENKISEFKDQTLTKKECMNLMFHNVKDYIGNEGLDAIKEVTGLLSEQNIKCK